MERGAARDLFLIDTYVPSLPPPSISTLLLATAMPPAAAPALSTRRRAGA
jgi:hypothetical protein